MGCKSMVLDGKKSAERGIRTPAYGDSGFQIHRNTGLCDSAVSLRKSRCILLFGFRKFCFLDNMNALAPINAMMDEAPKNGIILSSDSITPSEVPNSSRSDMKSQGPIVSRPNYHWF